ncbi:MAG: response regulator [Sphingobium sp.]|nr:response regulator [Sphingobium sp.]
MTPSNKGVDGVGKPLTGCSVLVVEDEYLIARDISSALRAQGAHVVGPCPNAEVALAVLEHPDPINGAVIDVNLRGVRSFKLAKTLEERGIRFVIATGYDEEVLPAALADKPRCPKPIDYDQLIMMLHDEMGSCH